MRRSNKKDCVSHVLSKEYRTHINIKAVEKLFSLAVEILKGEYRTLKTDNAYMIEGETEKGHTLFFRIPVLKGVSYWSSIPTKFTPRTVTFKSGYTIDLGHTTVFRFLKDEEGYHDIGKSDIMGIVKNFDNVEGLYFRYTNALENALKENPDSWVSLDKFDFVSWPLKRYKLCLKPFFKGISEGDIFNLDYRYISNRHRVDSYKDVYANRYPDFQQYKINVATKPPAPPEKDTCRKAKFGCSNGCTHSCLVDSVRKKNVKLYQTFSKLHKIFKDKET